MKLDGSNLVMKPKGPSHLPSDSVVREKDKEKDVIIAHKDLTQIGNLYY